MPAGSWVDGVIELALVPITLGLIALIAWQQQQFGLREKEWVAERAELLTRIQHPKVFVGAGRSGTTTADVADDIIQAVESDDIDLVGTVQTFDGSSD